jgi:hypothetical protein
VFVTDVATAQPTGTYDYDRRDSKDNAIQSLLPRSSPQSDAKQSSRFAMFWRRRSSSIEGTDMTSAPVWAPIELSQADRQPSISTAGLTLRVARSLSLNTEHSEALLRPPPPDVAVGTPSRREEFLRADATLTVDKMHGGSSPAHQQSPKVRAPPHGGTVPVEGGVEGMHASPQVPLFRSCM